MTGCACTTRSSENHSLRGCGTSMTGHHVAEQSEHGILADSPARRHHPIQPTPQWKWVKNEVIRLTVLMP